jgi:hypothetical protein
MKLRAKGARRIAIRRLRPEWFATLTAIGVPTAKIPANSAIAEMGGPKSHTADPHRTMQAPIFGGKEKSSLF